MPAHLSALAEDFEEVERRQINFNGMQMTQQSHTGSSQRWLFAYQFIIKSEELIIYIRIYKQIYKACSVWAINGDVTGASGKYPMGN